MRDFSFIFSTFFNPMDRNPPFNKLDEELIIYYILTSNIL